MLKILELLVVFLTGISIASAQTFDPKFDIKETADNPNISQYNTDVSSNITKEKEKEKEQEQNTENNTDDLLVPAKINLQNTQEEKTYDNSIGKVVEYKVINGKIEYGNPDDRKILVYIENYKVHKGFDGFARCSMRIYVLNDLKERINNLSFKLIWPEIRTSVQMVKVNPGVKSYNDIMLLGDGCFSIDKTPTLEINRCRVKGKTEEQCADAVHWFKR